MRRPAAQQCHPRSHSCLPQQQLSRHIFRPSALQQPHTSVFFSYSAQALFYTYIMWEGGKLSTSPQYMYVHIYMYIYMQKFRTLQKPSKAKLWEKVPGIFRFYFLEECMALRNQTLYESISVFFFKSTCLQ